MQETSQQLNISSAKMAAKEQRLAANHACAITASVRTGMKNGVSFKLISVKKIAEECFELSPHKTIFGEKPRVINNPEKWFRYSYNKQRLCNIKVVLPEKPSAESLNIDSEGVALACLYENLSALFVPQWQYDEQADTWSVLYRQQPCDTPALAKARFSDNSESLFATIAALYNYCAEIGQSDNAGLLSCAMEELDGKEASWEFVSDEFEQGHFSPQIRRPKLSESRSHIYKAASQSPVYGGKWYSQMLEKARENSSEDRFVSLMNELSNEQRSAMLFAVNEC